MGLFDHMTDDKRRQLVGVLLLFLGLLLAVSLGSHIYFSLSGNLGPDIWATQLGLQNREISNWMFVLLGFAAWTAPLLLIMWGWNRIADGDVETLALRSVFLTAVTIIVVTLIHVGSSGGMMRVSGLVGAYLSDFGVRHIGRVGTFLVGIGGIALITLLTTEFDLDLVTQPFITVAERVGEALSSFWGAIMSLTERVFDREDRPAKATRTKPTRERRRASGDEQDPRRKRMNGAAAKRVRSDPASASATSKKKRVPRIPTIVQTAGTRGQTRAVPKRPRKSASYTLPPLSLFDDRPADAGRTVSREELLARSQLLEEKLADFGVEATVAHVRPGPVITRFEVEPARGVKVSQIANLQDDLALAMRATAIRIIAPIPGRGAVGIEIPNENPEIVYLKETLASGAFQKVDSEIPLALGKDTTGKVSCADLAGMPHLLVAGATGSGKSICLNTLITGILCRSTPDEVRFLMIDPKRLELPRYAGIPHQISPVVTEAKSAAMALQWLVGEMDRRYDILSSLAVRDIYGFNKRIEDRDDIDALSDENKHRLPHIVVIVDEFADLMVRAPREVEAPVQRLAQMARAVGIHLIFATQRPSVDVITGVIKANFASRIAFRVISMTDSRTILDRNGAQTLLGNGDMLFMPSGKPDPIRLHGAFVSSGETARIVSYWRKQGKPDYMFDFEDSKSVARMSAGRSDELYETAIEIVVGMQMGSTSLLQRRLSVGYARAGRLMDVLEANGIVGPFKGSKARDVLVGPEYLTGSVATAVALEETESIETPDPPGEPDETEENTVEYDEPEDAGEYEEEDEEQDEEDDEEEYEAEEEEEDEEEEEEDEL